MVTPRLGLILLLLAPGCQPAADVAPPPAPPEPPNLFDPAATGTVTGVARWDGDPPAVADFRAPVVPGPQRGTLPLRDWPNPHRPRIDEPSRGVAGAVVYLRGVDARHARPWDHPPVRVELHDHRIEVVQGDRRGGVGVVRCGDEIEMVSHGRDYHALRVRGAAFFTRAFPDAGVVGRRALTEPGVAELSSPCGYFWMRGHVFVAEHPYYAVSGEDGRFTLPQVPAGEYEAVCWLPNPAVRAHERDMDTARVNVVHFAPPWEAVEEVTVRAGETSALSVGAGFRSCPLLLQGQEGQDRNPAPTADTTPPTRAAPAARTPCRP